MLNTIPRRTNNFDFIRLIAALSVVVSHQFALIGLPEPLVFTYQTLGGYAVMVFFAISGYLIASSWDREPRLGQFIYKRLLRIWPGLACTVIICGLILGPFVTTEPISNYFTSHVTLSFFGSLFFKISPFLPGVFPHSHVAYVPNGVLWTIPIEFRCYLYLAAIGVLGVFRRRWLVMAALVGLAVWYYGVYDEEAVFAAHHSHIFEAEYATFFFSGVVLHQFREYWTGTRSRISLIGIAVTGAAIAYASGHQLISAFILTPSVVVAFGASCTPVIHRCGRFGDLSYGVYIYAFPIQQTLIWAWPGQHYIVYLAITVPLVLIAAWLSWHLVEKAALKKKSIQVPTWRALLRRVRGRFAHAADASGSGSDNGPSN